MSKYKTLINILDSLRNEAPKNYKKYHDDSTKERINYARSLAYIHLYLKASFNLSKFDERENYITDGSNDGGIDAYYIDKELKTLYFIQSKFRTNEKNFETKSIDIEELSSMDINRITSGEKEDEKENLYNKKIHALQEKLGEIEQFSRYDFKVIILANLENYSEKTLKRIIGDSYEVFNYNRTYNDLVFPILRGTCHVAKEIKVSLNMGSKINVSMEYEVENENSTTSVQLFFIPTIEIARIMSEYRNSILEFNPRSYLGLSKNSVNPMIQESIIERKNNMFSLLNNGLTLLSDDTSHTTKTGKKGVGLLEITNPQIINGGQTAHTLATIFEDSQIDNSVFEGKEVLTKIITFDDTFADESKKTQFIEQLSIATNNQSVVKESDRRSNDYVQIKLQEYLFEHFGYYYHRKKGEFRDGVENNYILKDQLIDRGTIARIAFAVNGEVSTSRRSGEEVLFKHKNMDIFLNESVDLKKIAFSYFTYKALLDLEKNGKGSPDKYQTKDYGNALRYGKYAVVSVASKFYSPNMKEEHLEIEAENLVNLLLKKWKNFELEQSKKTTNLKYFQKETDQNGKETIVEDFDNYYKGSTIDEDIKNYDFDMNYTYNS